MIHKRRPKAFHSYSLSWALLCQARFLGAFSYWDPGVLLSITPSHGTEGTEVQARNVQVQYFLLKMFNK